ncbi:MAG: sulfatase-like hydrolase/transferase, partial [Saprospiraceae bacterium]|nr:sulfatase-like hydrolase/transferase [Saprospiraceae bacterium]
HTGHVEIRGNKQFGNREGQQPMTPGITTVATLAKSAGYHTGMIGKWGLGDPHTKGNPSNHGFDYFYGYTDQVLAHNYYPEYLWRNGEKQFLKNEVQYLDSTAWHAGLGSRSTGRVEYSHDLFIDDAVTYISRHQQEPFLLYLPLTIPHDNGEQVDSMVFEVPSQGIYANKNWSKKEKDYAASVTRMDEGIGKIINHLQRKELSNNTIIFFTSDNGPMRAHPTTTFFNSNGPLRGGKRDLYEGGIRVPMIVQWSGKIQGGSTSDHLAAFWDVLPTVGDLCGMELSRPTDGISFLPTLIGEGVQTQHGHLYWEFHESAGAQALRQGDWKMVKNNVKSNADPPLELYNLSNDIAEENNLAADLPEKIAALEHLLENSRTVSQLFPLLNVDN